MKVRRSQLVAVLVSVAAGALLVATAVPAPFTIDEANYLATVTALKSGSWALPGSEQLPPSWEWYAFDPWPQVRGAPSAPIQTTAPPHFAPLGVAVFWLGWRGLVALNAFSLVAVFWLVFRLAALYAKRPATPWIAAVAVVFGAFAIEYAQGLWPHMVSLAAITGALYLTALARGERGQWTQAAAAGFLAAFAAGLRYQNIVLLAAIGAGLWFASNARLRKLVAYGAAACIPLIAATAINHARMGIAHPATKGRGYYQLPVMNEQGGGERGSPLVAKAKQASLGTWTRIVDFSAHPGISDGIGGFTWPKDPDLGAFVLFGAVKKALFQSAPWVALGFVLLGAAWRRRRDAPSDEHARTRELRALSLVPLALLGIFSLAGTSASDGICFNARYFFEALPAASCAIAWQLESSSASRRPYLFGALFAAFLAAVTFGADPYSLLRTKMLLYVPLMIAGGAIGLWIVHRTRQAMLPAAVAAAIVWGAAAHLGDDLPGSRRLRERNLGHQQEFAVATSTPSAIFTYSAGRDALWPLFAWSGTWILDVSLDAGKDAPMLATTLLSSGRRVFVDLRAVPPPMVDALVRTSRLQLVVLADGVAELVSPGGNVELK